MHQFIQFMFNHWVLSATFVVLILIYIGMETSNEFRGMPMLTPEQAVSFINHDNATVVDVRESDAFVGGHVVNALHVPASAFDEQMKKLDKQKQKPVLLVCAQGQDSGKLGVKLTKQGFEQVKLLKGGLRAWSEAKYPLVKGK